MKNAIKELLAGLFLGFIVGFSSIGIIAFRDDIFNNPQPQQTIHLLLTDTVTVVDTVYADEIKLYQLLKIISEDSVIREAIVGFYGSPSNESDFLPAEDTI